MYGSLLLSRDYNYTYKHDDHANTNYNDQVQGTRPFIIEPK